MRIQQRLVFFVSSLLLFIVTPAFIGLFQSPAQAQCITVLGKKICGSDVDPTRIIPGSKEFVEQAWGEAGATAYQTAADVTRGRNGRSQGLDESQKWQLRRYFGDLVDRVAIIYSAKMMDQWSAFGKQINFSGVDTSAQTYCNRIYVRDSYKPNDSQQLVTLSHEMTHSKQCEQLGGEGKFGFHYFREFKRAGQNYENNKLETEAYSFEKQFAGSYRDSLTVAHAGTGLCLDAKDYGRNGAGTPIQLWNCNGEAVQKWSMKSNGSLVNTATGLCLDAKDYGRKGAGTPIQLWNCNGEAVQKWSMKSNGSLVNTATGLCLDAKDYGP